MCLQPLKAIYIKSCRKVKFISYNSTINTDDVSAIDIPCGKCVECLQEYSSQWAFRIVNEASLYDKNTFITLTYRDSPGELVKSDLQKFMKRLRFHLSKENKKIRYFACGEYGSRGGRPHYHLIIFGWSPEDLEFLKFTVKNEAIYKSKFLESVWNLGFVSVGELTLNSAKYCAKYMQKLNNISYKVPPFILASSKPGIGYHYALNHVEMINTDKLVFSGKYVKIPRYYLKVYDSKGFDLQKLRANRILKANLLRKSPEELELRRISIDKKLKI